MIQHDPQVGDGVGERGDIGYPLCAHAGVERPPARGDELRAVDAEYQPGGRARGFRFVASWAQSRGVSSDALFWSTPLAFYGIR
jgi:hypothetical protein